MALFTNNAEGGTPGQTATATRTGAASGTQFTAANIGAGSTLTFDDTAPFRGTISYTATGIAAQTTYFDWDDTAAATFTSRFYFMLTSYPDAAAQGLVVARSTGAQTGIGMELDTTGHWRLAGPTSTNSYTSSALALNTWYRAEFYGTGQGTTGAAGTLDIYLGDATGTPAQTQSLTGQNVPNQCSRIRYGKRSTAGAFGWRLDDLAQNIGSSSPLGGTATGDAGGDQTVEPWSTVTLSGGGTGSWTQTSGTTVTLAGSGATRTFTAPPSIAGGTLGFSYGGDPMVVTVLPVTERAVIGGVEVPLQSLAVSS